MLKRVIATAALVLLGTTTAAAQMHGMHGQATDTTPSMGMARGMMMGGMMGQGMMGSGMMQMMGQGMGMMATGGPGPMTLLRMQDELELTDEQVGRLESIQAESQEQMQTQMTAAMDAHREAAQALEGDAPDLQAYQQTLQGAANIMVQMHVGMARTSMEARDVLTPEQRERLGEQGPEMMQGMMGRYGWGGMMRNR